MQTVDAIMRAAEQLDAMSQYRRLVKGTIDIPAGTRGRPCTGPTCREMIFDVGRRPVSIAPYVVDGVERAPVGYAPTDTIDGIGISHFANCPDRNNFRRK